MQNGELFEIVDLAKSNVEILVEGINFAFGFDAELGAAKIDDFQAIEQSAGTAERLPQRIGSRVRFLASPLRFFHGVEHKFDVWPPCDGGQNLGRMGF